jgi:hypothetical protein
MARGWESKEVESQIEAAEARKLYRPAPVETSEDQREAIREIDCLQLSRTRILNDIEASENPRYREMLGRSLQFLDDKLAALEATAAASKPSLPE